ncbi:proteasome subunit beta [Halorarius halobius]|uniref:proteasome subunit beta n=1 Tax=Halorarius halobius TaxID=2962671 RepID=UPI0020CF7BDC|nr:proteasome subunit beta [Halorarius halobius]
MEGFTSGKGSAPESTPEFDTGTTTVGIVADDGVVLATDRRASLAGRFVSNKSAEKIFEVHPTAAITISGGVGDGQTFAKQLEVQSSLYETRRGEAMSMEALSTTAANVIRGMRVVPLLGGVDGEGGHLYSLDPAGGLMEDTYGATGSGMQLAYGVLEREFEEGMSLDAAVDLAVRAVAAASERDTASGNGAMVARITSDGVDIYEEGTEAETTDEQADTEEV